MNKKLLILGDIFYDKIYEVNNFYNGENHLIVDEITNIGGIGNFVKVLNNEIDTTVSKTIHWDTIIDFKIDEFFNKKNIKTIQNFNKVINSIIILDKTKQERTSIVDWKNKYQYTQLISNYLETNTFDWLHLMYVDMFDIATFEEFNKKENTLVSVDFCQKEHLDKNYNDKLFAFIKNNYL